jgi:hypothetical protein
VGVKEKLEVSDLRLSSVRVGKLYPALLDSEGNIIDGQHRLHVDKTWPTVRLEHIKSEEDRLAARFISNVCRRSVPAEEKSEILGRLGEIYLGKGVKKERIAYVIAEDLGNELQVGHEISARQSEV